MMRKIFNLNKWEQNVEYIARLVLLAFAIVFAMWTIFISPIGINWWARTLLSVFTGAAAIVFYFEARHLVPKKPSSQKASTQILTDVERVGRNKWIPLGLLAFIFIVIVLIFGAQQLPANTRGYQAFFTAFAGVATLGTGIALGVLAYQQYKLRQIEHRLLFDPQISLSGSSPKIGAGIFDTQRYPYRIEWSVIILNTSQIPILIINKQVSVKLSDEKSSRNGIIFPTHCRIVEPEDLSEQFEVTINKPCEIKFIIEGPNTGGVFDYVSGDTGMRDFVLVFRVIVQRPQDPEEAIFSREIVSWPIHVPIDAKWGISTSFLV